MRKLLIGFTVAAVLGLGSAAPLGAQESADNTAFGTTSAEFLLLGAGARGAALGGSFAALANDVSAVYWNAAGLALMERPSLSLSTYSYIADTRYNWAGAAFPFSGGQSAVGFQAGTFGFGDQPVYTVEDPQGELGATYRVSQTFLGATYARNFSDRFSAGLTAKMISDKLGLASATGFAVDFGTSFHTLIGARMIRASFVIQNLGSTLEHDGPGLDVTVARPAPVGQDPSPEEPAPASLQTKDFGLPVMFRLGLAYDVLNSAASRLTAMGEFTQPNNTNVSMSGGLEWSLLNIGNSGFGVAARGSYTYYGDNDLDASTGVFASQFNGSQGDGLAFGGGISWASRGGGFGLGVDYAYRNMGVLGGTDFFSMSLSW